MSITSGGITGVGQEDRFNAMGIDWMTNIELNEAIPPAYTEWIGARMMELLAVTPEAMADGR